jgi:tetratricopeptide (TPR) repeat protein
LTYKTMGDSEIREQLLSYTPAVLRAAEVDKNLKNEFINFTYNEVKKQIDRVPNDARYYILLGSLFNNIGDPNKALPYIYRAIELSPQKQVMRFELINSLFMLGRKDEALVEAKKAYELDTRFGQAKSIYEAVLKDIMAK